MLKQSRHIEKEQVQSLIIIAKLELITELSKDSDKMVTEATNEVDVKTLLAKSIEFIRGDEYLKNLLDELFNNDDLLDEFQDDLAIVATVGIIPLQFADQASESQYLEGDIMFEEVECAALV